MKIITISSEQKEILQRVIEERLKLASEKSEYSLSGLLEKSFKSILSKKHIESFTLNKKESISLAFLSSEMIGDAKLYLNNWVLKDWLNIPEETKKKLIENDVLLDILQQVKHHIKDYFRYNIKYRNRNVFEVIEKLKKSQLILLSIIENPYKICFIYQKEHLIIELNCYFKIEDLIFYKIKNYSNLRKGFGSELNKREAYEIISKCTSDLYPKESIEFIIEILK